MERNRVKKSTHSRRLRVKGRSIPTLGFLQFPKHLYMSQYLAKITEQLFQCNHHDDRRLFRKQRDTVLFESTLAGFRYVNIFNAIIKTVFYIEAALAAHQNGAP